jgi:hypothetical protein
MADENFIAQKLLRVLSQTRYACVNLTKLHGGTANFLYCGDLLQPLDLLKGAEASKSATTTVVVKHAESFSSSNRDFPLDVSRCVITMSFFTSIRHH